MPTSAAAGGTTARAKLVDRRAGDEAEGRVAVVEQPDDRGDADRRQVEGPLSCGIITAGAERSAYW